MLVPDRALFGERMALADGCAMHALEYEDSGQVYLVRVSYPATTPLRVRIDAVRAGDGANPLELTDAAPGSDSRRGTPPRRGLRNVEQELLIAGGDARDVKHPLARALHSGQMQGLGGRVVAVRVCATYGGMLPKGSSVPTHVVYDIVLETMVWGVIPRASITVVALLAVIIILSLTWAGPRTVELLSLDFGRARAGERRTD